MQSKTGIEFDRCVRVAGKTVLIVRDDKYIHIGSYEELERWCSKDDIEDVAEFDMTGMKQAQRFMRRRNR